MAPKASVKPKGPSAEALAALRERLRPGQGGGAAADGPTPATVRVPRREETTTVAVPAAPAAPAAAPAPKAVNRQLIADFNCEVPEPPQKKKRALPAAERLEKAAAEGGLSLPPFPIAWENLDRLKEFYKLTEEDTAKLLLQVLGPDPRATAFWSKYKGKAVSKEPVAGGNPKAVETKSALDAVEASQKRSADTLDRCDTMIQGPRGGCGQHGEGRGGERGAEEALEAPQAC